MLSLLSSVIPFIKEFIFGKKSESINDSIGTSTRKWVSFIVLIASLVLNYILIQRLYVVSLYELKLIKQNNACTTISDNLDLEKTKNKMLSDLVTSCFREPSLADKINKINSLKPANAK